MSVALGRKGGERSEEEEGVASEEGAGEKDAISISRSSMDSSEAEASQGGGRMLARCWRLRRRASQRGTAARYGGWRVGIGPFFFFFFFGKKILSDWKEPFSREKSG